MKVVGFTLSTLLALVLAIAEPGTAQLKADEEPPPLPSFDEIPDSLWEIDPGSNDPYEVIQRDVDIRFFDRGDRIVARIRRHERIRVLSDDPGDQLEASWISIPLPNREEIERVISLQGATRFEEKEPVLFGLDQMSEGEVNRVQRVLEYRFPEVEAGVILDLEYEVERSYLEELPAVPLTDKVPVRQARVTLHNEPWLRYRSVVTGTSYPIHHTEVLRDTSRAPMIFTIARPEPVSTEIWMAEQLPALPEKPYSIPAADRHLTLHLQLSEWGWPRQPLLNSWAYVEAELRRSEANPWESIRSLDSLRQIGEPFRESEPNPRQRLDELWLWFREQMTFNGEIRWVPDSEPSRVIDGVPSDQASINLAWAALLQGAGLDVEPVLVPHRESGQRIEALPSLTRFRQLLIRTTIQGEVYWMDASLGGAKPGLPRQESLGMVGWVLGQDKARWEVIQSPHALNDLQIEVVARLNSTGDLSGEIVLASRGYPAMEMREASMNRDGVVDLIRSMIRPRFGVLDLGEVTESFRLDRVRIQARFHIDGFALDEGDQFQFPPLLVGGIGSHPLGSGVREEAVRLDAPESIRLDVRVDLPPSVERERGQWSRRVGGEPGFLGESFERVNRRLSYQYEIELRNLIYERSDLIDLLAVYDRWLELTEEVWILEKSI